MRSALDGRRSSVDKVTCEQDRARCGHVPVPRRPEGRPDVDPDDGAPGRRRHIQYGRFRSQSTFRCVASPSTWASRTRVASRLRKPGSQSSRPGSSGSRPRARTAPSGLRLERARHWIQRSGTSGGWGVVIANRLAIACPLPRCRLTVKMTDSVNACQPHTLPGHLCQRATASVPSSALRGVRRDKVGSRPRPADYMLAPSPVVETRWRGAEARWLILSAEYGLVRPDQVIKPYDRTLAERPANDGGPGARESSGRFGMSWGTWGVIDSRIMRGRHTLHTA